MILNALVSYYEDLLKTGKISAQGWEKTKVSFALNLDTDGNAAGLFPLKVNRESGEKSWKYQN